MTVPLPKESEVDVLVIGAGPSGLMAANALAKAGVNVRIIDQRCARRSNSVVPWSEDRQRRRPAKVAAGQADGIQPRTIEVLQVRLYTLEQEDEGLIGKVELRLGRTTTSRRQSNAHGCECLGPYSEIDSQLPTVQAFYNPSPNGGIERTGRAPDVTATTARYPFEVRAHTPSRLIRPPTELSGDTASRRHRGYFSGFNGVHGCHS